MLGLHTQDHDEVFALSSILLLMKESTLSLMHRFLLEMMICTHLLLNYDCITTGNGVTGFHYDPAFLRRVHPCGIARGAKKQNKGIGIAALGAAASRPCRSKPERHLRSSARAATSSQEPSYLQWTNTKTSDTCVVPTNLQREGTTKMMTKIHL